MDILLKHFKLPNECIPGKFEREQDNFIPKISSWKIVPRVKDEASHIIGLVKPREL